MDASLRQLLQRPDLWRARQGETATPAQTQTTGFGTLDRALHAGGWPADGLVELLCRDACPLVLRLLLPAMAGTAEGLVVLAAPPARPHARSLRQAGLDLERLLILDSGDGSTLLRACREAAASETVALMAAWLPRGLDEPKNLRRLHMAARQGRCRLFLVRDARQAAQPSPAPLRLLLAPCLPGDLDIEIHKQPGGRSGQRLRLAVLPEALRTPPPPTASMPAPQQQWRQRSGEVPRQPGVAVSALPVERLRRPEFTG